MQATRAEEIIDSPNIIAVYYKENPVWLNHVNKSKNVVNVRMLGCTELENMEVPVAELYEEKPG